EIPGTPRWGARLFARARMMWQPLPAGVRERLPLIASRIAELDAMLQEKSCAHLLPQVYREIDELDREIRRRAGTNGASGTPVASTASVLPSPSELGPSLHVMRRAILFMEEVFISEDL